MGDQASEGRPAPMAGAGDGAALPVLPGARRARVEQVREVARDIRALVLVPADGGVWPVCEAGAHIDLVLPNGLIRQYSLTNPGRTDRYEIAVLRDPAGRGGSAYVCGELREGEAITIGGPRNSFPLREGSDRACLIAGGIGITPLLAMARVLAPSRRDWHLYYCVRDEAAIAFREELAAFGEHVTLHVDRTAGGPPSIAAIVARERDSVFYCCGPAPMLAAFKEATAGLPAGRANLESFGAEEIDVSGTPFEVELARSGRVLTVPADRSILDVVEQAGVHVLHSCRNGQCGTCEVTVLEGVPHHRDSVLTPAEQAAGTTIMVCCSRAKTPRLRLDL